MMCVELFPIVNILYRRSTHLLFLCLKSNICYILHSHTHLLSQFRKKIGKYFLFERHESLWNRTTMNNIIRLTYVDKSCEPENKLSKNNFICIPSWYLYIQPYHHYNDFYSTAISKIVINNKYRKCIFILFYTCIIPGSIDNII